MDLKFSYNFLTFVTLRVRCCYHRKCPSCIVAITVWYCMHQLKTYRYVKLQMQDWTFLIHLEAIQRKIFFFSRLNCMGWGMVCFHVCESMDFYWRSRNSPKMGFWCEAERPHQTIHLHGNGLCSHPYKQNKHQVICGKSIKIQGLIAIVKKYLRNICLLFLFLEFKFHG